MSCLELNLISRLTTSVLITWRYFTPRKHQCTKFILRIRILFLLVPPSCRDGSTAVIVQCILLRYKKSLVMALSASLHAFGTYLIYIVYSNDVIKLLLPLDTTSKQPLRLAFFVWSKLHLLSPCVAHLPPAENGPVPIISLQFVKRNTFTRIRF